MSLPAGWAGAAASRPRQNPRSLYIAIGSLLLGFLLITDRIWDSGYALAPTVFWTLLALCAASGMVALVLGERLPGWVGLTIISLFLLAQLMLLAAGGDPRYAMSAMQQLPIAALYLGWFVTRRLAVVLILLTILAVGAVVAVNPLFGSDGIIGPAVAVQAVIVTLLCFGAGSYLWWWTMRIATTDPLTQSLNRRGLHERLPVHLRRALRWRRSLAVVAIDFDGLKQLNDSRGHAAGDVALSETVSAWRAEMRSRDLIARTGGDEFVLVLPRTSERDAEALVSRLQRRSASAWSWGTAQARAGDTVETLIARADEMLYRRKTEGRDAR